MRADEAEATGTGSYELGDWDADGVAVLAVSQPTVDDALAAALGALLAIARGGGPGGDALPREGEGTDGPSLAAPIRGQGADYPALFTELAGDLLNQLDANGSGLDRVRLDGVLDSDDGFTAWGYALGEPGDGVPPVGLNLTGVPTVVQRDGLTTLRCQVRRS